MPESKSGSCSPRSPPGRRGGWGCPGAGWVFRLRSLRPSEIACGAKKRTPPAPRHPHPPPPCHEKAGSPKTVCLGPAALLGGGGGLQRGGLVLAGAPVRHRDGGV